MTSSTINSNATTTTTSISAAPATAAIATADVVNPAKSSISIKGTYSGVSSSKHGGTLLRFCVLCAGVLYALFIAISIAEWSWSWLLSTSLSNQQN